MKRFFQEGRTGYIILVFVIVLVAWTMLELAGAFVRIEGSFG